MTVVVKHSQRFLTVLAATALLVTGCTTGQQAAATQLTIHTTDASLDTVTALALAEYLQDQGLDVDVTQHLDQDAVYAQLPEDASAQHPVIGVVTATQDDSTEERSVQLPDGLDAVAAAPTELTYVAATSPITAQRFRQARARAEDPEVPLLEACANHTWWYFPQTAQHLAEVIQPLEATGCAPEFDLAADADYSALVEQALIEPATAVLLYSLDPVLADTGLTVLDTELSDWPTSGVVAVAGQELDAALTGQLSTVLSALDAEATTRLLRGYHNAQASDSDLVYEVEDAVRYWLAEHELLDPDTVINITDGNE